MFLVFLDGRVACSPFELAVDGDLLTVIDKMILQRGIRSVRISKVKGHADDEMLLSVGSWLRTGLVMILLTGLLILGGVESLIWSWMFVGVLFLPVLLGILLSWSFIASLLLLLVPQLMRMGALGSLCILLSGLVAGWLRGARLESLLGSMPGPRSRWYLEAWFCWLAIASSP